MTTTFFNKKKSQSRSFFNLIIKNSFNKSNNFYFWLQNGKYSCIAENRAGKADISHIVQIQIREQRSSIASLSSIKESPPTPQPDDADDKSAAGKAPAGKGQRGAAKKDAPPSGGGRRYAPQPPPDPKQQLFFIAFLSDRTIPEGGKTKISCYVEGPDPQARWFKG